MADRLLFQEVKACYINYFLEDARLWLYRGSLKAEFCVGKEHNCGRPPRQFSKKLIVLNWKKNPKLSLDSFIYLLFNFLILLCQIPEYWDCRCTPPHPVILIFQNLQTFCTGKVGFINIHVPSQGVSLPGPCVREGHSCTLTKLSVNTEHQVPPVLTYPGMVLC